MYIKISEHCKMQIDYNKLNCDHTKPFIEYKEFYRYFSKFRITTQPADGELLFEKQMESTAVIRGKSIARNNIHMILSHCRHGNSRQSAIGREQ